MLSLGMLLKMSFLSRFHHLPIMCILQILGILLLAFSQVQSPFSLEFAEIHSHIHALSSGRVLLQGFCVLLQWFSLTPSLSRIHILLFILLVVAVIGPSGCVRCHGNKVSTINGVIFSSLFSLLSAGLLFSQKVLS